MRTFPKHESKKETPCKKGTFRNEVPVLAGRFYILFNLAGLFLFYSAALIFDMLNAETLPSGETVALILKWLVFFVPSVS